MNFGTETISYKDPQLWNSIPDNIKTEASFELLKKKIRNGNVKHLHVEGGNLSATYRFCQLIKILASILSMVCTNLLSRSKTLYWRVGGRF